MDAALVAYSLSAGSTPPAGRRPGEPGPPSGPERAGLCPRHRVPWRGTGHRRFRTLQFSGTPGTKLCGPAVREPVRTISTTGSPAGPCGTLGTTTLPPERRAKFVDRCPASSCRCCFRVYPHPGCSPLCGREQDHGPDGCPAGPARPAGRPLYAPVTGLDKRLRRRRAGGTTGRRPGLSARFRQTGAVPGPSLTGHAPCPVPLGGYV